MDWDNPPRDLLIVFPTLGPASLAGPEASPVRLVDGRLNNHRFRAGPAQPPHLATRFELVADSPSQTVLEVGGREPLYVGFEGDRLFITNSYESTSAASVCGDRRVDRYLGEGCDDGNPAGGDGCTAECTVESGYHCPDPGSPCLLIEESTLPGSLGQGLIAAWPMDHTLHGGTRTPETVAGLDAGLFPRLQQIRGNGKAATPEIRSGGIGGSGFLALSGSNLVETPPLEIRQSMTWSLWFLTPTHGQVATLILHNVTGGVGLRIDHRSRLVFTYQRYHHETTSFRDPVTERMDQVEVHVPLQSPQENLLDEAWHHVAITWDLDSSDRKLRLYVDGTQRSDAEIWFAPFTAKTVEHGQHRMKINVGGDSVWLDRNFFHGGIDDVRIWDRALSSEEIHQLFETSRGLPHIGSP